MTVTLDFNRNEELVNEVNNMADSLSLRYSKAVGSQILYTYEGSGAGIFDLGKFIDDKGYNVDVASR